MNAWPVWIVSEEEHGEKEAQDHTWGAAGPSSSPSSVPGKNTGSHAGPTPGDVSVSTY